MKKFALVLLLAHGLVFGISVKPSDRTDFIEEHDQAPVINPVNDSLRRSLQQNDDTCNIMNPCKVSVPIYSKDGCDMSDVVTGIAAFICVARLCLCMP